MIDNPFTTQSSTARPGFEYNPDAGLWSQLAPGQIIIADVTALGHVKGIRIQGEQQ